MDYAVQVMELWKEFPTKSSTATVFTVLKNRLLGSAEDTDSFPVLQGIDITVKKGEKIGIIGNNGAGKTTLLKVIAGLLQASKGKVCVTGDMVLLVGLGLGMVDELNVEENIFLYATIYGVERNKIREKMSEIIEWAELQEFAGAKLRMLSSGMRSRLAFSVVRHIKTDIFLLDEALRAGDRNFREKCRQFFDKPQNSDKTFLVSTHDLEFVTSFCKRTLWLHQGVQMGLGDTEAIVKQYVEYKS